MNDALDGHAVPGRESMPNCRRQGRATIVLALLVPLVACHHYVTPKGITPAEYVAAERPEQVRVTLTDGTRRVLRQVTVSQDSIRGYPADAGEDDLPQAAWAAPLVAVERLEVYRPNGWANVGLVMGGVILLTALVLGTVSILILTGME
jgi:hypothetical protein